MGAALIGQDARMHTSPQRIRLSHEATVSWWFEDDGFAVEIALDALRPSAYRIHASDAFEALCLLREELEPLSRPRS